MRLHRLYWIAVAPFHRFIFPGLLAGICADAERLHSFVHTPPQNRPEPLTGPWPSSPARKQESHA